MAIADDEKEKTVGQHDDLGVHPERREAEADQWEKRFRQPSAGPAQPGDQETAKTQIPEEDRAVTKPDLRALEGGQNAGQLRSAKDSDEAALAKKQKTASSKELQGAEAASASAAAGSSAVGGDDTVGKGFNSKDTGRLGKFKNWASEGHHKKALIGGGVGGGIILAVILVIAAIVPFELQTIGKDLLGQQSKIEQHTEKKAARSLLQHIICWQLPLGCKKIPQDNDKPSPQDEQADAEEGRVLPAEMDEFKLTDPAVEADLSGAGITVETDAAGNFAGLKNNDGQDVTESVATDDTTAAAVESGLQEWEVGQEISFRPTMVDEAGSSFNVLSDDDNTSAETEIDNAVTKGANSEDISAAGAEEENGTGNTTADQQAASTASGETQQLKDITNKVEADIANGDTEEEAVNDAASEFGVGSALLWSQIATGICEVKEVADAGARDRIPTLITALIRHSTTVLSLASQMQTGKVTGNEVNQTMQIFNGDPSAPPNSDGTPSEATLPFSASAAWQRTTDQPVTTNTPDIDPSVLPTTNAGQQIVNAIDKVFDAVPGGNAVCSVLTSGWGILAQFGIGAIQLGATIFSGGEVDVGTAVAGTTAGIFLQKVVIPDIIKYFTPIGVSGREDSVQWLNNSDAGLNLAFGNYSRRLGGTALQSTQADALFSEATNEQLAANAHLPWTQRMFAFSNPDSLVSRLASYLPLGTSNALSGIVSYFTHLPSSLMHGLASIFTHKAFAQTPSNPGDPYGFTQYAFTDSDVDKYDEVANEQYLFYKINYNGQSDTRIDMLGNPNNYKDNPGGDSDNSDLLHCYVDSYATIEKSYADPTNGFDPSKPASQDPGADQNCGVLGLFDIAADPPNPTDTPNDSTAESIYCQYFTGTANNQGCMNAIASQVKDDVTHFRQYLLDTHVMADYVSLTNDQ